MKGAGLRTIGMIAVPMTFVFAGAGMLMLLQVENADGDFFQQIASERTTWLNAHLLLLGSAICMLPAALTLHTLVEKFWLRVTSAAMVVLVAVTSILLAGQYAIDFVVPLMGQVGGKGLEVHRLLATDQQTVLLFYNLPNLSFIAMMLLSFVVVVQRVVPQIPSAILILNWLAVLLGNLVHPAFQRVAILFLAVAFIPVVREIWRSSRAN